MGSEDSPTYDALLDATEQVMREEGYAAATSRRIAKEAGVKQQLVYYYFRTMDDLFLATFKRRTTRALEQVRHEVQSELPIHAIWRNLTTRVDAKLVFEFIALANHNEGIRNEVSHFIVETRRLEAAAIARQFKEKGVDPGPVKPAAAAFVMFCTSLLLGRESATGITEGHDDVLELIDWALGQVA